MTTRIKLRRDTATNWTSINPILAAGEPGLETDTGKIKYGDGASAWALLNYGGSDTLADDGSVLISAGSTKHWVATQRRDNYNTEPRGVRYDSEGNLYSLTKADASGPGIGILTKYTTAGAISWQKSITGFSPVTLAVDSNGCAYATGELGGPTITLIKFSSTGVILWKKDYNIGPIPAINAHIEEKSSSTMVVAYSIFTTGQFPNIAVVMEISNSDGSVLIKKQFVQSDTDYVVYVTGIDVDSAENVFVTGYYDDSAEDGRSKMFVEKLDENLERVWTKSIESDNTYDMYGGDCTTDGLGNVYAVGAYQVDTTNSNGTGNKSAGIITKLNASGVVQWTRRLGPGPCGSFTTGLTSTETGDIYLSAITFAKNTDGQLANAPENIQENYGVNKLIIARYTPLGEVVWQRYVDVTKLYEDSSEFDRGQAVAVFGDKFAVDGYGYSWETTPFDQAGSNDYESDYFVAQLPTDGTALTIGDLDFTESRIPARFITLTAINSPLLITTYAETILAEDADLTVDPEARVANQIVKSEVYDYTFGADGTLTIPNDGDIKLTQSQVGYLAAIGGSSQNNDDINSRAVTVDSQGYMYVGGEEQSNFAPFVTKIAPDGTRVWGVSVYDDVNGYAGRLNGIAIDPVTKHVAAVCEMWDSYNFSTLTTLDEDTGRVLATRKFSDTDGDVYLNDIAYTSNGAYVLAGSKFGEFSQEFPITKQSGSVTGFIKMLRSDVAGVAPYSWQIGGTGFSVFENVLTVNRYTGLTGTTRQGSGTVTFDIINNGNGTYSASVVSGGTNYLPGHKIKILGTSLTGAEATTAYDVVTYGGGFGAWKLIDGNDGYAYLMLLDPSTTTGITTQLAVGDSLTLDSYGTTTVAGALGPVTNNPFIGDWPNSQGYRLTDNFAPGVGSDYNIGAVTTGNGTAAAGATPANDIILTVSTVNAGAITAVTNTGTAAGTFTATATAVSGSNYDVGSGMVIQFDGPRVTNNYNDRENYTITSLGANYVENDIVVFDGANLDGVTTTNDLTVRVSQSGGAVQYFHEIAGTSQSTIWKIGTTTQVDFSQSGSWRISYPVSRQNFIATPTWQRTFGSVGETTDRLYAVAVDSDDNIIAVGEGYGDLETGANRYSIAAVYKFNSAGAIQWSRQLNEVDFYCYAKSVATIGTDIYVTHSSTDSNDTIISKLDAAGTVKWQERTDSNDDSVIAATADGNLLVSVEAYNPNINNSALKVFLMTPSGETIYKRWLSGATDQNTQFKNGRGLVVDHNNFYVSGYFYANGNNSSLAASLPLDGSGTGEYGSFRYAGVNYMSDSFNEDGLYDTNYSIDTLDLTAGNNYAGPLVVGPYVNTATTATSVEVDTFYVNTYYPDWTVETVSDTDGGRIVFADGTTQNTSATDWPQRICTGQRYTLGLRDRGHHIYVVDSNDGIQIPYYARVEFPIGTVIHIVNGTSSGFAVYGEGTSINIQIAGYDAQGSGYQAAFIGQYAVATLLMVGRDQWVISGNGVFTGP